MTPYDDDGHDLEENAAALQVGPRGTVTDDDGTRTATLMFEPGTDADDGAAERQDAAARRPRRARHRVHGRPERRRGDAGRAAGHERLHLRRRVQRRRGGRGRRHRRRVHQAGRHLRRQLPRLPRRHVVPAAYYDEDEGRLGAVRERHRHRAVDRRPAGVDVDGDGTADEPARRAHGARHRRGRASRSSPRSYAAPSSAVARRRQALHAVGLQLALRLRGRLRPARRGAAAAAARAPSARARGSIVGYLNQTLGEALAITGTPFALHYSSDRVPGYKEAYALDIPLTGAGVRAVAASASTSRSRVAGQDVHQSFAAGAEPRAHVHVGRQGRLRPRGQGRPDRRPCGSATSTPPSTSSRTSSRRASRQFGGAAALEPATARAREITAWQEWERPLGTLGAGSDALGGWTLDVHHAYDPPARALLPRRRHARHHRGDPLGDRHRRRAAPSAGATTARRPRRPTSASCAASRPAPTAASTSPRPSATASAGHAGRRHRDRRRRRRPRRRRSATAARRRRRACSRPSDVDVGRDGTLYIADTGNAPHAARRRPTGRSARSPAAATRTRSATAAPRRGARCTPARRSRSRPTARSTSPTPATTASAAITPDGAIATAAGGGSRRARRRRPGRRRRRSTARRRRGRRRRRRSTSPTRCHHRVRAVHRDGVIDTVAGNGGAGPTATAARRRTRRSASRRASTSAATARSTSPTACTTRSAASATTAPSSRTPAPAQRRPRATAARRCRPSSRSRRTSRWRPTGPS